MSDIQQRLQKLLDGELDPAEVAEAKGTIYEHTHAGWDGITTYTDTHGNTRTKTEVLVAMSSISGDAADDSVLAD